MGFAFDYKCAAALPESDLRVQGTEERPCVMMHLSDDGALS